MQTEMRFFGEVRKPQLAPQELIAACRHRLDAIRLCVQLSGMSNESVAAEMGIDKGNFSRIMAGRANFPDAKSVDLMRLCGNYAPMQYEAHATGFALVADGKAQRRAELLRELDELSA